MVGEWHNYLQYLQSRGRIYPLLLSKLALGIVLVETMGKLCICHEEAVDFFEFWNTITLHVYKPKRGCWQPGEPLEEDHSLQAGCQPDLDTD